MKSFVIITIIFTFLLFNSAKATNLRGQLVRYNPSYGNYFPLPGVRVDLMIWNGAQWADVAYAVSGNDGFYYFVNLPPGGTFQITIFGQFRLNQPMVIGQVNPPYFQIIPAINI